MKLLVHDLLEEYSSELLGDIKVDVKVIYDNNTIKNCIGVTGKCFWRSFGK